MPSSSTSSPVSPSPTQANESRLHYRWSRRFIEDDGFRRRLLLIALVIAIPFVVSLAVIADTLPLMEFDLNTTTTLQEIELELFRQVMVAISTLGFEPFAFIMVIVVALGVGWWLGWKDGLFLFTITAIQGGLNALIKVVVARPRPTDTLVHVLMPVSGDSFPSGHVMFYTVFFGFLFFLVTLRLPRSWLKVAILSVLAVVVLLVGPSRIYLGAHWLTDVIAAYTIGVVLLLASIELYMRYLATPTPPVAPPQGDST